ncbi:MAG: NAD(P)H-dependent oxidoreductase [Candidatus Woesearchaeota archaeon]
MKTLIVYAHPAIPEESHASFTLKEMKAALDKAKIEHETIDLYAINYDPVLKVEEHYASGRTGVSQQNREFQDKIRASDSLVFIYPVWWADCPAILKGFFDRVFTQGFAFDNEPKGILTGKKAAVMISTGCDDKLPAKLIKDYVLGWCGIETKVFQLVNVGRLDDARRQEIQANVKKAVRFLRKKEVQALPSAQPASQPSQQGQSAAQVQTNQPAQNPPA